MEADDLSLVIENGSSLIRYGISGNDSPFTLPPVIGTPKNPSVYTQINANSSLTFVGEEAIQKRGILNFTFPIEAGAITNYDAMKLLW